MDDQAAKPVVIIEMDGGLITAIRSPFGKVQATVVIVDRDTESGGDGEIHVVDGQDAYLTVESIEPEDPNGNLSNDINCFLAIGMTYGDMPEEMKAHEHWTGYSGNAEQILYAELHCHIGKRANVPGRQDIVLQKIADRAESAGQADAGADPSHDDGGTVANDTDQSAAGDELRRDLKETLYLGNAWQSTVAIYGISEIQKNAYLAIKAAYVAGSAKSEAFRALARASA